jgi:outer membrane protein assembly factor BamB
LAQGIIASNEPKSADEPAVWFASVDGTGAVLNPFVSNDLIVFANTDGDAIAFDGWTIRSVVGFGLQDPLSISGKHGVRTFIVDGQQTVANCDEWILTGLNWRQTCSNGSGEILLNEEGNIQKITMPIGDGSAIVTLRVAK